MAPETSSSPPAELGKEKCVIFSLIENHKWGEVVQWVKFNPSDASVGLESFMGSDQANLALHEACKNQPPVDVVTALLDANSEAVKVKGQWGYLPLHYACSSGASKEVVAKLIETDPTGTRIKATNKEALPLHLACKWGMDEDAILTILTSYPEAIYIKDSSGKTALDYAKALSIPEVREGALNPLRLAPTLCVVSKAATERVAHEKDARIKGMAEAQAAHVVKLEARYLDQLNGERAKVLTLTSELGAERNENEALNAELRSKDEELENLMQKMDKDADEASSTISQYLHDLEEERATIERLTTDLQNEQKKNADLEQELKERNKEIIQLKLKMEDAADTTAFFVGEIERSFGFVNQVEGEQQETKSREELQGLMDAVNEKIKAMEAFQPMFEEADKERKDLTAILETERKEAESRLNEAKTQIENLEAELSSEQNVIKVLKATIRQLEEANESLEKDLAGEKERVENLMEELDTQKREHMLEIAEFEETVRCKESKIEELKSRLDVHQRAQQALASKAKKFEKMRQEGAQELKNTLSELKNVRLQMGELKRELMNSTKKNEAYAHRMVTLHKWVSSLSHSIKSWTVEKDWEQRYSGREDSLHVMAKLNEPPPDCQRVDSEGDDTQETEPSSVKMLSSSSTEDFFRDSSLSPPMHSFEYHGRALAEGAPAPPELV